MKIENAVLLVTRPQLSSQRAGGLTVLERQLFTARRAGISRLWIGVKKPSDTELSRLRLPEGLEINWSQPAAAQAQDCPPPYVVLSGDHFIRVETLRHILNAGYGAPAVLEDPDGRVAVQVVPFRQEQALSPQKQPLPIGVTAFLEPPLGSGPVLSWLLATGTKPQDGFMARHFDRHISLAFSRLLLDTPVTPNVMTLASSALGLYGATFFLAHDHASQMAGAVLVWLHSVLDGCDGELARMRFQESRFGAAVDFWGDNLVHLALFGCLSLGFAKADRSALPLVLGAIAAVGTIGSAVLVYLQKRAGKGSAAVSSQMRSRLQKLEDFLAARDFIYLLLVLAYLNRTYEFMWASAVGSVLFLFMTLYLGGQDEQASQPYPAH